MTIATYWRSLIAGISKRRIFMRTRESIEMNDTIQASVSPRTGSRPVRVVALEWNLPMLIDVLVELSKRYGWELVYCVSEGTETQFKRHFPSAIYHDTVDARFGRPPPELRDMPVGTIDQPTFEALGSMQLLALKQMNRQELLGGFALHDRIILFNRLTGYWSAVFDKFQPDVLINPNPPHVVYDYIAHAVARSRGVRTIMFEWLTSTGLLAATDDFGDGVPSVMEAYRRLCANPPAEPVVLSERMEEHWRGLRGDYERAKPFGFTINQAAGIAAAQATQRKIFLKHARSALTLLLRDPRRLRSLPQELARAALIATAPPTVAGHYQGRFFKTGEVPPELARRVDRYRRQHVNAVKSYYDSLATAPDLEAPYVYVALHAQPERSTNPNGGVFDEQDVMIGLIASAVPKGWRIYVKEHPGQFFPFLPDNGRWTTTYDAMLEHPGVSFVPRNTSSFDLIDNAKAVASISGTACWEAVVRGIPALVFGEAWYKGCEGTYNVRSCSDCKHAVARIAAGARPDPEAVRLFLRAIEEVCVAAYVNDEDATIARISPEENVALLAQTINYFYVSFPLQEGGVLSQAP
jgi:hypothetical protein